jgi:uncharacterized protein
MSTRRPGQKFELERRLETSLRKNYVISQILNRAAGLRSPNWYLGAGSIAQIVWNELHDFPPDSNIKDYDLVYFDASDLSREVEESWARKARKLFRDLHANWM